MTLQIVKSLSEFTYIFGVHYSTLGNDLQIYKLSPDLPAYDVKRQGECSLPGVHYKESLSLGLIL